MDIRNGVLNVADKVGIISAYVLSFAVILASSYLFGYRIADALYEPYSTNNREEFSIEPESDILLDRVEQSEKKDVLGTVRQEESRNTEEPVNEDGQSNMGSIPQEDHHIQSEESDVETYSASEFETLGEFYDGKFCYKWYSQQILPGDGLSIPGRYVDEEGYVRDEDGNLCVASNRYPIGTQIEVPFGDGYAVVYDTYEDEEDNLIDVYTNW